MQLVVLWSLIVALAGAVGLLVLRLRAVQRDCASRDWELGARNDLIAALARAGSVADIVDVTVSLGLPVTGASRGAVLRLVDEGRLLETWGSTYTEALISNYARMPIDDDLPVCEAARTRRAVFLGSPAEYAARFPKVPREHYGESRSWAALPLEGRTGVLGVLALSYAQSVDFDETTRGKLMRLAWQTAQALERAQLYDAQQAARDRTLASVAAGLVGAWSWDRVREIVHLDPVCAEFFGVSALDAEHGLPSSVLTQAIAEEDRARVTSAIEALFAQGDVLALEYRVQPAGRATRWLAVRGRAERDEHGKVVRIAGASADVTDRKRTEEQLRAAERDTAESRALLDTLLEATPVGLAFLSPELRYISINRFLAELNGVPVEQTVGRHVRDILPPEAAELLERELGKVLRREVAFFRTEYSLPVPGAPGRSREWTVTFNPIGPPDEPPLGCGCVVVETTERKRAAERSRSLQIFIAELAAASGLGALPAVIGEHASKAARAAAVTFFVGRAIESARDEAVARVHRTGVLEVRDDGTCVVPATIEGRVLAVLVFEFTSVAARDETGVEHLRDLGREAARAVERLSLLEAERAAAARLRLIADSSRLFVTLEDPDLLVHAAAELVGEHLGPTCIITLADETGTKLEPRAVWNPDPAVVEAMRRLLAAHGVPISGSLAGGVAGSGEPLLLGSAELADPARLSPLQAAIVRELGIRALMIVPVRIGANVLGTVSAARTSGVPYTVEDRILLEELAHRLSLSLRALEQRREIVHALSETEEARAREQQARRAAERANRAKDEFLAMLGHELRNPLSPILTALQLMRLRGGDQFERERAIIERQVTHMVRLVDDLLDVSRITQGKVELKKQPLELASVVAAAIETVSPLLERRAHRLSTDVQQRGCVVNADPERLTQVISNLLTNAAKYTDPGGSVTVTARCERREVVLRVRDTGIGIHPELLPRIFGLFTQGERTLERSQGGLGLGLSIVHSLVQMHGGSVEAHSEGPGLGSEFVLRLPAFEGAAARPLEHARAVAVATRDGPARRILVVDDNHDAAASLGEALAAAGHDVVIAVDGPSALAAAMQHRPHVIFLDIGLPVMDGYEVARRLRVMSLEQRPTLVAITGYGQDSDRQRSREAGFDRHLVKPVALEQTLAIASGAASLN